MSDRLAQATATGHAAVPDWRCRVRVACALLLAALFAGVLATCSRDASTPAAPNLRPPRVAPNVAGNAGNTSAGSANAGNAGGNTPTNRPASNAPANNNSGAHNQPAPPAQTQTAPAPAPSGGPFTLAFSNDISCWFLPCGCKDGMSGGLPRRATLLKGLARETRLLVDLGDAACGPTATARHMYVYTIAGLAQMGYDAFTFGAQELALLASGPALALPAAERVTVPWVSANVRVPALGELPAFRVVTRLGVRFGITAVTSASFAPPGRGVQVQDARGALGRVLPKLQAACDVPVLLAATPEAEARALAAAFPAFGFVLIGGPPAAGRPKNQKPEALGAERGAPYLARVGDRGRFQGFATFTVKRGALAEVAGRFVELSGALADDADMLGLLDRMRITWPVRADDDVVLADNLFVGAEACVGCHDAAIKVWRESKHARAFEALQTTRRAKHAESNPRCLQCHTLGFNQPEFGGYTSIYQVPRMLKGVSCGNCHGRASIHADLEEGGKKDKGRTLTNKQPKAACKGCHDRQNDPDFDYQTAWKKIEHR